MTTTEARVGRLSPRRQAMKAAMATLLGRRRLLIAGPQDTDACCLTFDDGPHPEHTPRLLDVLGEHGIPATFFVVGQQAERYPDLVRRIVRDGHALGHHSWTHGDPAATSAEELRAEARRTRELLRGLGGTDARLFRPPKGSLSASKLWLLVREGLSVVLWNLDPGDYSVGSPAEVEGWLDRRPLRARDLVLLHDTRPHAACFLPAVVRAARSKGVRFGLVSEWAA